MNCKRIENKEREMATEKGRVDAVQILTQNSNCSGFVEAEALNSRRQPFQRTYTTRSKEFHLQIPLHVLRTGSIAKEFLLDRGFRVRSKVRNGETANGPSGMICAQHTQELQNRKGKTPSSPPSIALFLAFSISPLICVEKIRQRKTKESERERRSERNDEWRARDRAREIKKVDNNAVGAPSIPWYQAQQAAIIIVLPLHLGQREANVPRKAEYARAFDEQTESGRKKKDSQGRLVMNEYDRDAKDKSALIHLS
ncbi:hypothetical protein G5I_01109 [Acromyrmex echinatior]|uniref:Uncharacterized protein n=1 Tax=Acromyrmex echinatior TaxID=103372 RepID=F4W6L4_ACREC|nr:hypothetical protein G5I_01109 [Acromyrmex echinatior]